MSGLDSVKEELSAILHDFLRHGMATFTIDGPGQGEAPKGTPLLRSSGDHVGNNIPDG